MRALQLKLKRVAMSDATVLVTGETGVGKELVARELHSLSHRAGGPFIAFNCAALTEELILSELFGHERGAFTGAVGQRAGHLERAQGGTLFLDEVGDMSLRGQVALLRALQERTFERVGGGRVQLDVRVIAATNRDLGAAVRQGTFRQDLYFRLKGIHLEVPALRERGTDVLLLAAHFLAPKRLHPDAERVLLAHAWPGNVRELENVARAAAVLSESQEVTASVLGPLLLPAASPASDRDFARSGLSLKEYLREVQRACVKRALQNNGGVIAAAAAELGMSRSRLSQVVHDDPALRPPS